MRKLLAVACAAGSAVVLAGQAPATGNDPPPRDRLLQTLALDAAGIPAEFEADALLRIARASAVDNAWRRELIDDAFMRAYAAQEPYRRSAYGVPPNSRQGAMQAGFDSHLTQVSLQVRAVQMMALVDGAHARELFQWIAPGVEATPCDDLLVPALAEYYTTLGTLARTTFSEADHAEALRFLEYYLWRAHLPSEMPSVAQAIQRFKPTIREAPYLEGLVRFIFEAGVKDPRGFSVANLDLVTRVAELEDADRSMGLTIPYLPQTLHDYLRAHMTGARCADSTTEPVAASAFNARIRRTEADKDGVPPLDGADLRPSRLLGGATIDFYRQTSESSRLQSEFMRLRGTERQPVSMRVRQQQPWREQAERFIVDLDRWNGVREPTVRDYFYQKAVLFTEAIDLIPPGGVRTHAIRSFIDFLRHADIERSRRALWFVFTNRLLGYATDADRTFVLDAMEASGQPILSLYARLERVLPQQTRTRPRTDRGRLPLAEERGHPQLDRQALEFQRCADE